MFFLFSHPQNLILVLLLTSLLSGGLGIANNGIAIAKPSPEHTQSSGSHLPKAISRKLLRDASKRSGVKITNLKITQATSKTFSNLCVFKFGEVCTQQYDPISGWLVNIKVKEQVWTYHVDKTGSQAALDPKILQH